MQLLKVDLFVFKFNPVAIHCYKNAEFEIEEIVKDRIQWNENFVTLYLMGLEYQKWITSNKQPIK